MMKRKIYLYWFRDEKLGKNFGDELSAYIIERLFNVKIEYAPIPATPSRMLVRGMRQFFKGQLSFRDFIQNIKVAINGEYLVAIGSILGYTSGKNATIWGAGLMRSTDVVFPSNFLAVRGKKTQERMRELGLTPSYVIGDPALLANLVYDPIVEKKYELGIIPHYSQYAEVINYQSDSILVINLLEDIESVIRQIKSCNKTISTSLHGIIISHTYNVPSLWAQLNGQSLHGDNFKFEDYFSSVGIEMYEPIELTRDFNYSYQSYEENLKLPNVSILEIQENLKNVLNNYFN